MKNFLFAAFVCLVLNVSFAFGQSDKETDEAKTRQVIESKRAEMKKAEQLVGQWQGSGWIMHGNKKVDFAGTETVQRKVGGLALLVEGNFKNKEGVVIHETLAVLSPNLKTNNYDFRTYLANGTSGLHEFKSVGNAWQWGLQIPNGTIRYDIKIENEMWFETGEISMDGGKTWMKFFEMSLKKVK